MKKNYNHCIKKIIKILIYLIKISFDLLFPVRCISCGKYGQILCQNCYEQILWVKTSTCLCCGKIVRNGEFCGKCRIRDKLYLHSIITCCHYENGPVKSLVYALKYNGIRDVSELLAEILYCRINTFSMQKYVITYVPLSKKRLKTRGFNQSELLARHLALRLGLPCEEALKRVVETRSQVGLSAVKRKMNVSNAFSCVSEHASRKNYLIIDDVTSTHATLNECAKVLRGNGAKKVVGLVIATNK